MTEARRFLYRGAIVIEGWPEQMLAAQEIATRRLGDREVPRVRYGDESDDWGANRHPCGRDPGRVPRGGLRRRALRQLRRPVHQL